MQLCSIVICALVAMLSSVEALPTSPLDPLTWLDVFPLPRGLSKREFTSAYQDLIDSGDVVSILGESEDIAVAAGVCCVMP